MKTGHLLIKVNYLFIKVGRLFLKINTLIFAIIIINSLQRWSSGYHRPTLLEGRILS